MPGWGLGRRPAHGDSAHSVGWGFGDAVDDGCTRSTRFLAASRSHRARGYQPIETCHPNGSRTTAQMIGLSRSTPSINTADLALHLRSNEQRHQFVEDRLRIEILFRMVMIKGLSAAIEGPGTRLAKAFCSLTIASKTRPYASSRSDRSSFRRAAAPPRIGKPAFEGLKRGVLPRDACSQCLEPLLEMAGFQLSIDGRFWVSTEGAAASCEECRHGTGNAGCVVGLLAVR